MSFSGYLISIDGHTEDLEKYIVDESYHVSKKPLDLDSKRDGDGKLQRNVLDHVPYTVNFSIRRVNNTQLQEFLNIIRSAYTLARERKLNLTFYDPETDDYITQEVYIPDPDFNVERIDRAKNEIYFRPTQIKFIGY